MRRFFFKQCWTVFGVGALAMGLSVRPLEAQLLEPPGDVVLTFPSGLIFGTTAWADFNQDGHLDFLMTGRFEDESVFIPLFGRVYRNSGPRENPDMADEANPVIFVFSGVNLQPVWLSAAAWGDYDRDGDLDLVLAGATSVEPAYTPRTVLYRNDGDTGSGPMFTPVDAGLPDVFSGSLAWGDYDNDGDLDLVITGATSVDPPRFVTQLYRNEGNDRFAPINAGLPPVAYSAVTLADYDNDMDLDVLLSGVTEQDVFLTRLYRNDGGVFTDVAAGFEGLAYGSAAWGDADNDGDLDVLLAGARKPGPFLAEGLVKLYRNDGGIFVDVETNIVGAYMGTAGWLDYDNDGDLDVLMSGVQQPFGSEVTLYSINGGNGTSFTSRALAVAALGGFIPLEGLAFGTIAWGDYDGDNSVDLILTGTTRDEGGAIATLYRRMGATNAPPTPPAGLQASVTDTHVILSWSPGSDVETPTAGLTYTLRVGTSPGGYDIVSPHSVPSTGKRQVMTMGNVGSNRAWSLSLPPGQYYWGVQAVDAGYVGSAFSEEATFTVGSVGEF